MEFRANQEAVRLNLDAETYFTSNLSDQEAGIGRFRDAQTRLGNAVECHPDWHPALTAPNEEIGSGRQPLSYAELHIYRKCDHTKQFVRGMLTCPYGERDADDLVAAVNAVEGLRAERLDGPLYADNAYPVLIEAYEIQLEADGTIRSRDALAWFTQATVGYAREHEVAETWWNIRELILGRPHGARSSLLVNDFTGRQMRKILETLNESGIFGPIKEVSLAMLSERKRDTIGRTLLQAALDKASPLKTQSDKPREVTFELRGEHCTARIHDTWGDGHEYSVQVSIGKSDLNVRGYYYPSKGELTHTDPTGKRKIAEKFV